MTERDLTPLVINQLALSLVMYLVKRGDIPLAEVRGMLFGGKLAADNVLPKEAAEAYAAEAARILKAIEAEVEE